MSEPRAYTVDEVLQKIIQQMKANARYWATVQLRDQPDTILERIEGALFSTLVMFDGGTMGLPGCDIVVRPHPSDKEFHISEGENWYEDGTTISTQMHEYWHD